MVIATGVRADGWREVLGFAVGDSEDGAFWTEFLRSLKARRELGGVQLVGVTPRSRKLVRAFGVVKRSVVGETPSPCWLSSCRVSAMAWPIEFGFTSSISDKTFCEQICRR